MMAPLLNHTGLNYVAVNLSPLQLQDASLAGYVADVLKQADMPSSRLLLEVTESVMLTDNPQVRLTLETLQTSGVLLALDDFGAGYSNLSSLVQLRVNLLKIDRGFIRDLEGSLSTGIMIRSITALAHELGIEVVIEGVETEEQRALIASYGCDFAQGYLFCRPLPLESFKAMIGLAQADLKPPQPAARSSSAPAPNGDGSYCLP
jgi:EAL domain-containing protein (putative c-di-GMP-specific phosphodiesterase class I)